MSDSIQPPFTRVARGQDDLTCGRGVPENHCQEPATHHVMWDSDGTNTLCCDEHMGEALLKWVFYGAHELGEWCTTAGVRWYDDACRPDPEGEVAMAATKVAQDGQA